MSLKERITEIRSLVCMKYLLGKITKEQLEKFEFLLSLECEEDMRGEGTEIAEKSIYGLLKFFENYNDRYIECDFYITCEGCFRIEHIDDDDYGVVCNFKDDKNCHFYVYIKSENIDIVTDGTLEEFCKYFDIYRKVRYALPDEKRS